jgi:hypothetical protein
MAPKKDNQNDIEQFKSDFCDKYQDTLPKRTTFV